MATVYQAGGDDKGVKKKTVPKLMARVKIERQMEGMRRERDRLYGSIENERKRSQQSGVPVNESVLKMLRRQITDLDNQVEDKIVEIQQLEGSSDDTQDS